MLNKTTSFYKNNLNAKRGRQFLAALANIGIVYVLSVLLFTLCFRLIGDNIPSVKSTINEITNLEQKFYDERAHAGFMIYEENKLLEEGVVVRKAIKNETKSALIHYNLEEKYQNFDTYKSSKIIDKENLINNAPMYYFCDYKVKNETYYTQNPAKTSFFSDYYENILVKVEGLEIYSPSENNEIRYFTKDLTLILADYYFAQDHYPKAIETNDKIFDSFMSTYINGLKDFDENNSYAKSILDEHTSVHSSYADSLIIELFLSYLLASFITYYLTYLIRKDYSSLGDLILKTPIVTNLGNRINPFHELGIFGINFISNIHVLFFVIFTVYNNPGLSLHYFGFLNIGLLSIFGFIFGLISLILMLFFKNHQYIDAFSMLLTRKNRDEIKVEEENGTRN